MLSREDPALCRHSGSRPSPTARLSRSLAPSTDHAAARVTMVFTSRAASSPTEMGPGPFSDRCGPDISGLCRVPAPEAMASPVISVLRRRAQVARPQACPGAGDSIRTPPASGKTSSSCRPRRTLYLEPRQASRRADQVFGGLRKRWPRCHQPPDLLWPEPLLPAHLSPSISEISRSSAATSALWRPPLIWKLPRWSGCGGRRMTCLMSLR